MTTTEATYCDSCTNAAQDEAGFELDDFSMSAILGDMGTEIPDHICDAQETGQKCLCACNRARLRRLAKQAKSGSPQP